MPAERHGDRDARGCAVTALSAEVTSRSPSRMTCGPELGRKGCRMEMGMVDV